MTAAEAYRKAVLSEKLDRTAAFLRLPERVGMFYLRPLTAGDYSTHVMLGSPFVAGGTPTPSDVWAFIWYQSVNYAPNAWFKKWLSELKVITHKDYIGLVVSVRAFVADSLSDLPHGKGDGGPAYYSWLASVVDTLASEYGWSRDAILDLPLRELGQYISAIKRRHNSKAIMFNQSDRLIPQMLREAQETNGTN